MLRFVKFSWRAVAALAALAVLLALPALAERTRYWRQSSYDEFDKGTPNGVALRSDGRLVLAPRFAQFSDPSSAYLWALRQDSKGNLYAAGGSNARVLRFDAAGNSTQVFESQEMAAQALAIDARDNLYVGTSPDGKVYRITPKQEGSIFFEPKTKYIWDLAVGKDGTLYVATGDKGEVYAVTPDGKGELFYKSEDTHVRSLAFDPQGRLILGTEPNGLILRVVPPATARPGAAGEAAATAFVIYETSRREVTSLLYDKQGNLYAAAIGEKSRVTPAQPQQQQFMPQTTVTATGQTVTTMVPVSQQPITQFAPFPPTSGGSEVYRLDPAGAPEVLWSSRDELVYSLGLSAAGKLLLGTGNRGLVIQLEGSRIFSSLAKTSAAQVTGLLGGSGGKVYVCTANPGKVFVLGPELESEGAFESQTFDAKIFSQWGQLRWWGENGTTNGQVAFYVRTGNTSNPEKNWSPWAGPYRKAEGQTISVPPARFAQWKAVFGEKGGAGAPSGASGARDDKHADSPTIGWVSLAYLPKNVPPTIDSIVVQNPGIRVQGFAGVPQQQIQQPVQLRLPQQIISPAPGVTVATSQPQQAAIAGQPRFQPPPQGFAARGMQSVLWSARDENEDELVYSLFIRGEGESAWRLLKDKVEQTYYSWDTTSMPDGAYYLKIVASDSPANPPEDALTAERESDRFEVDNTPPVIVGLAADAGSAAPGVRPAADAAQAAETRVRFTARDSYSPIARAEYSLNSGDWKQLFPIDRIHDSPVENYELVFTDLPPGEHTLGIRIFDQFENSTASQITFRVEPPPRRR
jgi:sugar lactone lactonase YvrE